MKNARKFQKMRGEISTLIIAGVLVVAGVGVLMSSTLNQNRQTTNTKAAEGCSIESISADLSGGICKFTINYTPTATNPSPRDLVCALINPKRDPNISFNQLVAEQRAQLPAGWDVFSMSKNGRIPLFSYSKYDEHLNPVPDGGNYRLVVYDWRRIQTDPNCVRTVDIPSGTVTSTFGGGGGGTENPTNTPVPGGGNQPTPTNTPVQGGGQQPAATNTPRPGGNTPATSQYDTNKECVALSGRLDPDGADTKKKITVVIERTNTSIDGQLAMSIYGDGRDKNGLFINTFPFSSSSADNPNRIVVNPDNTGTDPNMVEIPANGYKTIVFEAGIRETGTDTYKCKKATLTCVFSTARRYCSPGGSPSDATGSTTPPTATPTTLAPGQPTPTFSPTPSQTPRSEAWVSTSGQNGTTFTTTQNTSMPACSQTIRTGCYQSL